MDIFLLYIPLFITYLLLTDFRSPVNRWGSLTLSLAGLGGLYGTADPFRAVIWDKLATPDMIRGLNRFWVIIFVKTPLCLFPVALLMFAVHYSQWNAHRTRSVKPWLTPVFLIPALVMYFIPLNPKDYWSLRQFLILTDLWAFPYLVLTYLLLYHSVIGGRRRPVTDRLYATISIVAISFVYVIAVYLLPFYHFPLFKVNLYLVIFFWGLFFFLAVKYGFLGLKLAVRNLYLDHNIKIVDSEVSVLNYQIKDQLNQIMTCARELETTAEDDRNLIEEKANLILAAASQISQVTKQLHYYLDKTSPHPTQLNLGELVKKAISSFQPQIKEKALHVVNNLPPDLIIRSDRFYLLEVLKHILGNSLEALARGGSIKIDLVREKRKVALVISDTGCGIAPHVLPHVLKPFFTTKDPANHFGLGLSYCYNVMQHLGGQLAINSTGHKGTTVVLKLPV
jgi:two-component system sporulation sensor kinase B